MSVFSKAVRLLKQVGGATAATLLVSIASVLSAALLLRYAPTGFWLAVAVGQAMGDVARSVAMLGYSGSISAFAAMSPLDRRREYVRSVPARFLVAVLAAIVCVVFVAFMPLEYALVASIMAVNGAVTGLSGTWFFIADHRPSRIIWVDAAPRVTTILGASLLVVLPIAVDPELTFGGIVLLGTLIAATLPLFMVLRELRLAGADAEFVRAWSLRSIWGVIRSGSTVLGASLALALRISVPVIAAPILLSAAQAEVVALADKLLRWFNTGITPLVQVVQAQLGRVVRLAGGLRGLVPVLGGIWSLGVLIGVAGLLAFPWLSALIGGSDAVLTQEEALPLSLALFAIVVSQVAGFGLLVLFGRRDVVFWSGLAGVAAVVLTLSLIPQGAVAAELLWVLAISELVVLVVQHGVLLFIGVRRKGGPSQAHA